MPLSADALRVREERRSWAAANNVSRVSVFTVAGEQVGLAGLGSGDTVLTFPAYYIVAHALESPHWLRYSRPGDEEPYIAGKFTRLEFWPSTLVHCNGEVAALDDRLGMFGSTMTALAQKRHEHSEEVPLGDLTGVVTPPTP